MTSHVNVTARWAASIAAVLLAGTAAGGGPLQRLPPDRALTQGDGSPGTVTFSHGSHVDAAAPSCLQCHPRAFRMLEPGKTASGEPVRHEAMEGGAACGLCHGKSAFGFESCEYCHK
jgi:c(7)-type cytochrome triheme protein